jgi:D-glycero-D-manno-heptose 1,7-bisphosphate phosphatase
MCNEFLNAGVSIDKVYISPFHPTEGLGEYKKDDFSRKPNPGMVMIAQQELNLNLSNSILIGDKASDIHAGIAARVSSIYDSRRNNLLSSAVYPIRSSQPFANRYLL